MRTKSKNYIIFLAQTNNQIQLMHIHLLNFWPSILKPRPSGLINEIQQKPNDCIL